MSGNIGPRKLVCAHIPQGSVRSVGRWSSAGLLSLSPKMTSRENHFFFSFLLACASCISRVT